MASRLVSAAADATRTHFPQCLPALPMFHAQADETFHRLDRPGRIGHAARMVLLGALTPVGVLLSIVLIAVTAVGSSRATDPERSQRAAARARRAERG